MIASGMEARLSALFDRQRKVNNPRLARLIGETDARWGAPLADDDLASVTAAGDLDATQRKNLWEKERK